MPEIKIKIQFSTSPMLDEMKVSDSTTVGELCSQLKMEGKLKPSCPYKCYLRGKVCQPSKTLAEAGIANDSIIFFIPGTSKCTWCARVFYLLAAVLAATVGWISNTEVPMGTFFWLVFQPMRYMDKWNGKMTPVVPDELMPIARPANEISFELPSGAMMPGSGIGMCCRGTAYDEDSVRASTLWYLLQGGRLIDTAALYLNHESIGLAIKDAEARGIPRSEIFVTTKIWPSMFGRVSTEWWVDIMLRQLQLDYVDLVLLHAPFGAESLYKSEDKLFNNHDDCSDTEECWEATWGALANARKEGKVRDIGISNFNVDQIKRLQRMMVVRDAPIAVNQVPFNPWVPEWQKEVVTYCQENKIALTGYSTLGGFSGKDNVATATLLQEIAKTHNVSVFLVLARWSLQKGVAVIPGTGNPKHMASNLLVHSFELSAEEMSVLDSFKPDAPEAPLFFAMAPPKHIKSEL